jgi:hypothetical protein
VCLTRFSVQLLLRPQIVHLETALAGRAAARPKLMEKLRGAIRQVARERAEVLRKEAAKLQVKFEAHRAAVAQLLSSLKELDGCDFGPRLPVPDAASPGFPEAAWRRSFEPGPVTLRLQGEIADLHRQAAAIREAGHTEHSGRADHCFNAG